MKKRRTDYNILKIILFLTAILIIGFLSYLFILYQQLETSKIGDYAEIEATVINSTEITTVDKITFFQEKLSYYIVTGTDEVANEYIAFLPETTGDGDIQIIETSETIPQDTMKQIWNDDCNSCKLKKMNYAKINGNILWELTYIDQKNRYVMDYFDLFDGKRFERLRLYINY